MKNPDKYEILERAHEAAGVHMMQKSPRADELIACLEGEIAKRDARIVGLESQYQRDVWGLNNEGDPIGGDPAGGYANDNARLRAELAAIKAQEPVAWAGVIEDCASLFVTEPQLWKAVPLYAAPVSEAKAQGVVMPDVNAAAKALCNRHAMICGVDVDDQWKQYSQDFIEDAETVLANARLNAAPVQHPKCKTCDDNGRIGGPSFYAPDDGGEPCPDCSAPVQQVSVPDGKVFVPVEVLRLYEFMAASFTPFTSQHEQIAISLRKAKAAMLAAAPAAPAADAGLVEALDYQVLFDAIAAATSVYANGAINISVQAFRDALAASRANGVV